MIDRAPKDMSNPFFRYIYNYLSNNSLSSGTSAKIHKDRAELKVVAIWNKNNRKVLRIGSPLMADAVLHESGKIEWLSSRKPTWASEFEKIVKQAIQKTSR